jgi:hypothetical protein
MIDLPPHPTNSQLSVPPDPIISQNGLPVLSNVSYNRILAAAVAVADQADDLDHLQEDPLVSEAETTDETDSSDHASHLRSMPKAKAKTAATANASLMGNTAAKIKIAAAMKPANTKAGATTKAASITKATTPTVPKASTTGPVTRSQARRGAAAGENTTSQSTKSGSKRKRDDPVAMPDRQQKAKMRMTAGPTPKRSKVSTNKGQKETGFKPPQRWTADGLINAAKDSFRRLVRTSGAEHTKCYNSTKSACYYALLYLHYKDSKTFLRIHAEAYPKAVAAAAELKAKNTQFPAQQAFAQLYSPLVKAAKALANKLCETMTVDTVQRLFMEMENPVAGTLPPVSDAASSADVDMDEDSDVNDSDTNTKGEGGARDMDGDADSESTDEKELHACTLERNPLFQNRYCYHCEKKITKGSSSHQCEKHQIDICDACHSRLYCKSSSSESNGSDLDEPDTPKEGTPPLILPGNGVHGHHHRLGFQRVKGNTCGKKCEKCNTPLNLNDMAYLCTTPEESCSEKIWCAPCAAGIAPATAVSAAASSVLALGKVHCLHPTKSANTARYHN